MSQWIEQFKLSDVVEMEKHILSSINNDDSNFAFASATKPSVTSPDALFMNLANDVDVMDEVQEHDSNNSEAMHVSKEILTAIAPVKEKQEPPKKKTKLDNLDIEQQSTQMRNRFKEQQRDKKRADKKRNELFENDYDFGKDFWADSNSLLITTTTTTTTTTNQAQQ